MNQTQMDYEPCAFRGSCREYNSLTCNEVSFQEICLIYMDFKFEERRVEDILEDRITR
ncbi:hypothetical protein LCGC14_1538360 [marine sediment metagenome]|uniref:Uncharacterized protein n=1 Tax=marine sediment metagenome TaxID=412755 RepID=A0A0F9LUP0_9ZZZZ